MHSSFAIFAFSLSLSLPLSQNEFDSMVHDVILKYTTLIRCNFIDK